MRQIPAIAGRGGGRMPKRSATPGPFFVPLFVPVRADTAVDIRAVRAYV